MQPVIDAPKDIFISRHLVAIDRFMVRAELINPRRKISRFGIHDRSGDALAVTTFSMTVLAAVHIELFPRVALGSCGRHSRLRQRRHVQPYPSHHDASAEHHRQRCWSPPDPSHACSALPVLSAHRRHLPPSRVACALSSGINTGPPARSHFPSACSPTLA